MPEFLYYRICTNIRKHDIFLTSKTVLVIFSHYNNNNNNDNKDNQEEEEEDEEAAAVAAAERKNTEICVIAKVSYILYIRSLTESLKAWNARYATI